jgi:hypothetical protein
MNAWRALSRDSRDHYCNDLTLVWMITYISMYLNLPT